MNQTCIHNLDELEEMLSEPTAQVIETLSQLEGDLLILGAGGKMGPSFAHMAKRGLQASGSPHEVIAVSRFSDPQAEQSLQAKGVQTIRGDLLNEHFVDSLPDAPTILYLVGHKFGTTSMPSMTWAINCYLPSLVCRRFPESRIVVLSSGNIYGNVDANRGQGSVESDSLNPAGEYGMACLGRERIFEYHSLTHDTPMAILRLNYATEMRYGVLVDLAVQVKQEKPIALDIGYANVIWQADAVAHTLCSIPHSSSPPCLLNITGPELVSCRDICEQFGQLLGKPVQFSSAEGATALLNDAGKAFALFGKPRVGLQQLVAWTADWIANDRTTLDKPTHFEVTDGKY